MKHIILLLLATVALLFPNCKSAEMDFLPDVGVTREQVVAIATKYGLQDSIAEGYKSFYHKLLSPEEYSYSTTEYWESFFEKWRNRIDNRGEFEQFRQEFPNVTSMAMYFELVEKYPKVHQSMTKSLGGIEAYNKTKEEFLQTAFHIYLRPDGYLFFLPAAGDDGTYPGKRLDKEK